MKKNVTAKDIAKLCGVSQATVSYVINNRQNQKISEETRRKVLDAVEALHYYPNASAKSMRTKNCTSIGIVCAKDRPMKIIFPMWLSVWTGFSQKKHRSPMHLNMPCRNVPPSVWKRESAKCGIFPSAMTVF